VSIAVTNFLFHQRESRKLLILVIIDARMAEFGRRTSLRGWHPKGHGGSSPPPRTREGRMEEWKEAKDLLDGVIMVKFGRKTYPTRIDSQGVQRFITDEQKRAEWEAGKFNLNDMAVDVIEHRMKKIDLIELRMSLGMSVCGMMDAYPYFTVKNPLWDNQNA
jgi:hypothetical protein